MHTPHVTGPEGAQLDMGSASEPYPWPWDACFSRDRLCLVVAGPQLVHARASVDVPRVDEAIAELAATMRREAVPVCHLRHLGASHGRPRPLLPTSTDPAAAPYLPAFEGDLVIESCGHDGFLGSALDAELRARGRDLLAVVGLAAEVTVSCTVRSANDRGYECVTLSDAIAPLDPWTGARELSSVTMSGGIFGAVAPSDALVSLLRRDLQHPRPAGATHTTRSPHDHR